MNSPIILTRVPFRISLGGGSTDLPSYYEKYGGFIFSVAINLYMDVFIKEPKSDDLIHVHYRKFEAVRKVNEVQHDLAKEALRMTDIREKMAISFKADTPAGTGLGSSGACSVALLKGLYQYKNNKELSNERAAALAYQLTRNLNLPDGMQDPYACALGGFRVFEISKNGKIEINKPKLSKATENKFFKNTIFFYTGIQRASAPILAAQNEKRVLELKHKTKEIGKKVLKAFETGRLNDFGLLMDEHWQIKKEMSGQMSNTMFDHIYAAAKKVGALGGKIMGAGGGGYFMFYCDSEAVKKRVRSTLMRTNMREMDFRIDKLGARTKIVDF